MAKASRKKTAYVCQSCGASSPRWFGRCPECGEWNTCAEEIVPDQKTTLRVQRLDEVGAKPLPITAVELIGEDRRATGIGELDRALGGGIVPGSVVLIGGDPGIGKSTLLLQASGQLGFTGEKVLYVSGEESMRQTRLRAGRIGALTDQLFILSETNMDAITAHVDRLQPTLVVVDSIQTIYRPELESAPGSVSQVRECAAQLMYLAKRTGIAVFLVGHVTKEGAIAGPRLLEHMVDTVLYLEGERAHSYRILRAVKNRFGSTNEVGLFEMRDVGLIEVTNPSEIFLPEREGVYPGSVVVCSMEGTRPLLVEIQALVSSSTFGYPQRVATGVDPKRVSILLAVLEKRVGLKLSAEDVFLNVAGGVRLDEPAVELGMALAVASSFQDRPVPPYTVAIGEVGLSGEIRPVGHIPQRLAEVHKLGFQRILLAKGDLKGIRPVEGLQLIGVAQIEEALEVVA